MLEHWTLTPRFWLHCAARLVHTAWLKGFVSNVYARPFTFDPLGSQAWYSFLAAAGSNRAFESAPSPRYPTRPLLSTPPVASVHVVPAEQTASTRALRSMAVAKAWRPGLPASPAKGPLCMLNPTQ